MIKNIIFDFDGVLVDSEILVAKAMTKYLAEKMNLPEKLIRDAAEQQELANQLQTMQQQGTLGNNELERPQGQ